MAVLRVSSATELAAAFIWGSDFSGSEQGAGGVGGLLFARFYPANNYNYTPPTVVYYGYDGNGNVTTLYNPASQSVAAVYEYDAFGQILRQTGPTAAANPFRFSTKFTDDESGLNYYGYRYYSPWMGRWISRDPIGEKGGVNLFGILSNSAIANVDYLGKYSNPNLKPLDGPYNPDWDTMQTPFGKFEVDQSNSSDYGKGDTSDTSITFTPRIDKCKCKKIKFVQAAKLIDNSTGVRPLKCSNS